MMPELRIRSRNDVAHGSHPVTRITPAMALPVFNDAGEDGVRAIRVGAAHPEAVARVLVAAKAGATCAECGRRFAVGEVIFRRVYRWSSPSTFTRPGGWCRYRKAAPVCGDCVGGAAGSFTSPLTCRHCDRGVRIYPTLPASREYCSETCRVAAQLARVRDRRAEARAGLRCQACGEAFAATRADQKFCGAACKQRAYRRRSAKAMPGGVCDNRNAVGTP